MQSGLGKRQMTHDPTDPVSLHMAKIGKMGGLARTPAKIRAVKKNLKKARKK